MDVLAELTKSFPKGDVARVHAVLDQARVEGRDKFAYARIAEWLEADVARLAARLDSAGPTASPLSDLRAHAARAHRGLVVTMMRDEEATVAAWLAHHHTLGFRRFVLVDHLSADGTVPVARAAAAALGSELVVIRDDNPRHQQAAMTTGAARYGLARWPDTDWVLPLDADEFLSVRAPLPELLAPVSTDTVHLLMVNQVSELAVAEGMAVDTSRTLLDALRHGLPACMYKVAVRAEALQRLSLTQGNHFLEGGAHSSSSGLAAGLALRHVANRDAPSFLRKVETAVTLGYGDARRPQPGGGHWRMWATMLLQDGPDALLASWTRRQSGILHDSRREPDEVVQSFRASMALPADAPAPGTAIGAGGSAGSVTSRLSAWRRR